MWDLTLHIEDKYQIDRLLGSGSFGEVYQGHDLETGQEVALKLEYSRCLLGHLDNEIEIYRELSGGRGIPKIYWYEDVPEFRVMAFELLGPSLQDLLYYCGLKFSLKTVLLLADQLIPRFQYIHSKGYIHKDIKPSNLLMGDGKQGHKVYITDLGLAREFVRSKGKQGIALAGTVEFANIAAHLGKGQLPRDEMESLGYVLLYLLQGSLPWLDLKAESEAQRQKLVLEKKQLAETHGVFKDLPAEFNEYFEHLRSLRSDENPNYSHLRCLFNNLCSRMGYEYDEVFDWTELKFLEFLEKKAASHPITANAEPA